VSETEATTELTLEELIQRISDYLQAYHNGSVEMVDFADGEMQVRFGGHCAGCPHMQATLSEGVAKTVQRYFPDVQSVVAV
jgi:Fe-S cluster biogenesis protein NfuA